MPQTRRYTVTQTREVRVTANSAIDAVIIAGAAFQGGQDGTHVAAGKIPIGVWGNTQTPTRVTSILVKED